MGAAGLNSLSYGRQAREKQQTTPCPCSQKRPRKEHCPIGLRLCLPKLQFIPYAVTLIFGKHQSHSATPEGSLLNCSTHSSPVSIFTASCPSPDPVPRHRLWPISSPCLSFLVASPAWNVCPSALCLPKSSCDLQKAFSNFLGTSDSLSSFWERLVLLCLQQFGTHLC